MAAYVPTLFVKAGIDQTVYEIDGVRYTLNETLFASIDDALASLNPETMADLVIIYVFIIINIFFFNFIFFFFLFPLFFL